MEKLKIKLGDILQLESEINGLVSQETGEVIYEGFLKQKLNIVLKYDLTELSDFLKKERKKIETLRDDIIKKYGEDDGNGGVLVRMFDEEKDEAGNVVKRTMNPKYVEFDKEYGELLNKDIDIEHPEITKEDLKGAGKTKDDYKALFKLIKK